nr:putative capsid protein [Wuhan aphid virus 1]
MNMIASGCLGILLTTTLTVALKDYMKDDRTLVICSEYTEPWRISMCASSQLKDELISTYTYITYLQDAMALLPGHSKYTSIGVTTGHDKRIVLGQQLHAHFDWAYDLKYDPRDYYMDKTFLAMRFKTERPILLYTVNFETDVPEWNEQRINMLQPGGDKGAPRLYTGKGYKALQNFQKEDCTAFYDWEQRESYESSKNTAILMDPKLWCPIIKSSFEVVVAEIRKSKIHTPHGDEIIYETIWENAGGRLFGDVPKKWASVFL